ncbi:hypothetical protein F4677DRAFT_225983 [Hypoxylon crocopeplum]|nr:hypothetical protein F4677DRAFT_225983 [Hypoxylon crocopeplum]
MFNQRHVSARRLAAYLLLWNVSKAVARPNPQQLTGSGTETVTPVTSTATVDGKPVTATYTPTSISITGLAPPITAATTLTTTDSTGATVAVAVAAGAGVVAGGALVGWIFNPVAGVPPAPTTPPPYSTSAQNNEQPSTTPKDPEPTTTSNPPACPFPIEGSGLPFAPAAKQPAWTAEIPSQTSSSYISQCTPSGSNGQLLPGVDPGFIKELSTVFCKNDQSKDVSQTIGKNDLPDDSSWKRDSGPTEEVKFTFDFKNQSDGCASHCQNAYSELISSCQFNSHYLYGGGSLEQGCGNYTLKVQGDPVTKLMCTGDKGDPLKNYMYRDAAQAAIENFCKAQDGKVVKQKDEATFIKETTFSISYAETCGGSGSYTVKQDLCVKYLTQTLDGCDTDTMVYKHGGGLQDMDNCGLFEFHPTGYDRVSCYPDNAEKGYITGGEHVAVTKDVAQDAIGAFCDRSGGGQQYTLDPAVKPDPGAFVQDTCKQKGMASCGYFYRNDGTRMSGSGIGDIFLRISAAQLNAANALQCSAPQVYEIHGDRCKQMLGKLIGDGSVSKCVGNDKNKLDLGTFVESGEKGCVTWNMWAVKTH